MYKSKALSAHQEYKPRSVRKVTGFETVKKKKKHKYMSASRQLTTSNALAGETLFLDYGRFSHLLVLCSVFILCACVLFGSMLFLNVISSHPRNCFLSQSAFAALFLPKALPFPLRTEVIRKTGSSINVTLRLSRV